MTSKMLKGGEDSIVGYNKRVAYYTDLHESDDDYEEENFYDHYEPYEEDFDDGDYQPFIPDDDEEVKKVPKSIKLCLSLNSVEKSPQTSPNKSTNGWWDNKKTMNESPRIINGVLNYAALLPPPLPKPEIVPTISQPKNKKNKKVNKPAEMKPKLAESKSNKPVVATAEVQKPSRFCISVIKKTKCFHGKQCRFAHNYSELKECNFGEKCKKIKVLKTNPDGTLELANKSEVGCNFKHSKETKNSYLNRVPQQYNSPKK